jgi:hypothetical protein
MMASRMGGLCLGLASAVAVTGCASSGTSPATRAATAAQAVTAAVPPPVPRLSILSPRTGAHTGPTVTVRVALGGAPSAGGQRFRYVLDRRLTRSGAARLTFHGLASGRHRLVVFSTGTSTSQSVTMFTVRTPRPTPSPVPAQAPSTVSSPAQSPPAVSTPPPTATSPPQAPAPASAPSPSVGIPQNGGGDGDADNSGGPSDGDGNL